MRGFFWSGSKRSTVTADVPNGTFGFDIDFSGMVWRHGRFECAYSYILFNTLDDEHHASFGEAPVRRTVPVQDGSLQAQRLISVNIATNH